MRTSVVFIAQLLVALSTAALGQQCPDWSSKFDQIDDPAAVQELQSERSQGWPNFNPANNGGASLQQSIAQGDQLIQQLQQGIQNAQQAWTATRGSNAPMPNVSSAECRSNNMGANMAAACQAHTYRNELLGVEGMNDLMRCRAGMPAGSYSSIPSASSASSDDSTGSPTPFSTAGAAAYDRGASSVGDLNVSKRAGMVNSVARNWQPPAEQQAAQASLAQNTALADPFAEAEVKGGGDSSGGGSGSSASEWSDPLAAEPSQAAGESTSGEPVSREPISREPTAAGSEVAPDPPPPAEIAQTLDEGTAASGASEVSVTPVAQVAEAAKWDQFAASTATSDSSSGTLAANTSYSTSSLFDDSSSSLPVIDAGLSDDHTQAAATSSPDETDKQIDKDVFVLKFDDTVLNRNPLSRKVTGDMLGDMDAYAHQVNHITNDIGSTLPDLLDPNTRGGSDSGQKLNSDVDNIRENIGKDLIGYKYWGPLDQKLTTFSTWTTKKVNTISCAFSFNPYCK